MKASSPSHGMLCHLRKLIFFGLEHQNADGTIDVRSAVVGVAAFFCATAILVLLFLERLGVR